VDHREIDVWVAEPREEVADRFETEPLVRQVGLPLDVDQSFEVGRGLFDSFDRSTPRCALVASRPMLLRRRMQHVSRVACCWK
jgi:hypothetical protein